MNLTEMESKVREATNNEPWGASSTLMQQIAAGTYNYREREEIVSFIFRRFTEKAANEWRQIYKSLQLLEYLIKNGSERIIDDVRSNLSLIQMLKSFHYIDSKGRDQGLNVRNRSKTLISLLNDDALIRSERKKARNNAKKFGGVSSGAFGGAASITPGSNAGYDDDYTNKVYGDGGVYGERYEDPAAEYNSNSNENFEEYDVETSNSSSKPTTGSSKVHATATSSKSKPQPQEPQQDLLQDLVTFDGPSSSANANSAPVQDDDDDFDDFQAAPSQPQKQTISNSLSNLYQQQPQQQSFFQQQQPQQQPNVMQQQQQFSNRAPSYNNINTSSSSAPTSGPAKSSNNDAFSSLFSSAKSKTKTSSPSINSPKKEQNTSAATTNNDDFFGDFSSNNTSTANGNGANANNNSNNSNSNAEVDLLSF